MQQLALQFPVPYSFTYKTSKNPSAPECNLKIIIRPVSRSDYRILIKKYQSPSSESIVERRSNYSEHNAKCIRNRNRYRSSREIEPSIPRRYFNAGIVRLKEGAFWFVFCLGCGWLLNYALVGDVVLFFFLIDLLMSHVGFFLWWLCEWTDKILLEVYYVNASWFCTNRHFI